MSAATIFSTFVHSAVRAVRSPVHKIDLSRLSAHDIADLNLPAGIRARLELRRELDGQLK